ncbi:hypothetical protein CDL15_Pgr013326 [Punica granatum]|uniref:Uncharacterized protein n=1 Tax=Punica granatum TaxID=22663 RepID=A0A218WR17_PUNGR|nr:hypothetical protein CDL15_Pgr013326 [Punica granatum]
MHEIDSTPPYHPICAIKLKIPTPLRVGKLYLCHRGMLEVVHKLERPSEGAITGADQRGPKKELSNELARQSTKGGSHDLAQWFLMARRSLEMAGGGTPAAATRADPPIEKREKNCETR